MSVAAEKKNTNALGLSLQDYKGLPSTLCKGCGHNLISNGFTKAYYEMGVPPHTIAKLSGIGCSSKSANYFLDKAHGFNGVHGRMAAMAVGTNLANHKLHLIGVSGDGDTASIGLNHFCHMIRRNVNIVYVIENNGVYGLTKGQSSATADKESVQKSGAFNRYDSIDCCATAIQMGCGFVARSFAGDPGQVQTLLKAAIEYEGTAVIDILSPCITFNNHEGSTKSIAYARSNASPLHGLGFAPSHEDITVDYEPGEERVVHMHSGAHLHLRKIKRTYDASDYGRAMELLDHAREDGIYNTGLLYFKEEKAPLDQSVNITDEPLALLPAERVRPSKEAFDEIMNRLR